MRDNVSFSLVNFFIIFRHWAGMFRPPHFFSAWLSKFHSPPPVEHFEYKKFLKKKSSFRFRLWKETFSALCEKHSRRGCQPQSTSSQGSFGRKILYWKRFFLSFFSDHDWNILGFCRTKFNRVINMHSTCHWKSLEENKKRRWKKTFRIWKKNLRRFCQNFNSHVHENSLNGKTFWNNFNFRKYSYTERKKVRRLSKVIWPSGENCILRVHWKNMEIKIWVDFFSGHWIKTLQFGVKNYGPGLSKLHHTRP